MLLAIVAKAESTRLLRATEAVCTGAYFIRVTQRRAEEIQGEVVTNQGITHRVTVWASRSLCSCLDSRYNGSLCTHAIALVLQVIRHLANPLQDNTYTPLLSLPQRRPLD